jgi:hypothetical protein
VRLESVESRTEAATLDDLTDNMMLFKDMSFKGYSEEIGRLREVLKGA